MLIKQLTQNISQAFAAVETIIRVDFYSEHDAGVQCSSEEKKKKAPSLTILEDSKQFSELKVKVKYCSMQRRPKTHSFS